MTNLDRILKSRDITWPTKVHIVNAMVFPVVMHRCESWNIKKAECQRIDAFELWCWKSLLRVPWTTRRSNQSILKAISPEYTLEGLMLKLQYFGYLKQRANLLKKTLVLGKIEGRRRGGQMMRWLDGITYSTDMIWASSGRWWRTGKPGVLQSMGSQSWTQLSDWTAAAIYQPHNLAGEKLNSQQHTSAITGPQFLISKWKGFKTKTAPKNWPTALQQPFAWVLLH